MRSDSIISFAAPDFPVVLTYVAELSKRKNQMLLLKTIEKLVQKNKRYVNVNVYVLCQNLLDRYVSPSEFKDYVSLIENEKKYLELV